ncbi:hypothetical protein ILUMI_13706 [Ignelater luminosus]|uniref:Cytochrome c oxidase subunit 6C n=1 Tax=Ignelater luminosus TaxID=2038154 RepID=A0A8K0CW93_IGNLU|nr:hypothetical protein ILUMI_13706 [Ignelater luminosus]
MSAVAKPELRRLLYNQIKTNLIVSIGLGIVGGIVYKIFICDARKAKYSEFYRNYDIDKEFERIKSTGVFDSCPPGS